MLTVKVPETEMWDDDKQEFVYFHGGVLRLEHSLVSVSKWESRHNRSFLAGSKKDPEEIRDYIRCMSLDELDETVIEHLTNENISEIIKYIEAPMTATYLREDKQSGQSGGDKLTSELIYYWMIALGIPFECQNWHLNRLMTLIRVCAAKSRGTKHGRKDMLRSNAALNAARRSKSGSRG